MPRVRVFKYIDQLDAFIVTDEYRRLADQLGLTEWNPAVWIGRLFTLARLSGNLPPSGLKGITRSLKAQDLDIRPLPEKCIH
jgi:hypothetical protein